MTRVRCATRPPKPPKPPKSPKSPTSPKSGGKKAPNEKSGVKRAATGDDGPAKKTKVDEGEKEKEPEKEKKPLSALTIVELKARLAELGLPTTGLKQQLVARLTTALESPP